MYWVLYLENVQIIAAIIILYLHFVLLFSKADMFSPFYLFKKYF